MFIKLKEAQKIDSSQIDEHGRLVAQEGIITRDILINNQHIVSISEESKSFGQEMSRIETISGSVVVVGSLSDIQQQLYAKKPVLKG